MEFIIKTYKMGFEVNEDKTVQLTTDQEFVEEETVEVEEPVSLNLTAVTSDIADYNNKQMALAKHMPEKEFVLNKVLTTKN